MGARPLRRRDLVAGALLYRAGPLAAYGAVAVCLLAAVLVPLGLWRPAVVLPVLALAAVVAWRLSAARRLPAGGRPETAGPERPAPVAAAAASLAVAVAFAAWAAATSAEHVVLRRDAGSYALYAQWLATRHGLPVDAGLEAFGGPAALSVPGLTVASPGFFAVPAGTGVEVVPQFLLGAPAVFSLGWWAGGGWTGLLLTPAVAGGLAVLAAAGLVARLVGPGWAPVGAAALALTQPVLHAARSTYSEPVALLLVLAAAALAVDAVGSDGTRARRLGLAAGLVLGLAGLVRVDAVREVALLLPCCAVLALRRHPAAVPMATGALAGSAVSAVPALLFSRPYLESIRSSLLPLVAATAVLALVGAAAVLLARRRTAAAPAAPAVPAAPTLLGRWAPRAAAAAVLLLGLALATRPWWGVARQPSGEGSAGPLVESLQRQQGLPVDGTRSYAEQSLAWTTWYAGWPAAVAAVLVLAVLAARAVRWWQAGPGSGPAPVWLVPAVVGLGSTVLTLYRPGITPDHPWADRRLVVTVLPTVVVAATAAAAWVVRWRASVPGRPSGAPARALALLTAAALLVPAARTTLPVATQRTEVGEPAAVAAVCAALRHGDAVVAVDATPGGEPGRAANEWPQVVRGVCGRPAAALLAPAEELDASLDRLAALTRAAGTRLVLLSAPEGTPGSPEALASLGLVPTRVTRVDTVEDERLLTRPPRTTNRLAVEVWLAPWPPS